MCHYSCYLCLIENASRFMVLNTFVPRMQVRDINLFRKNADRYIVRTTRVTNCLKEKNRWSYDVTSHSDDPLSIAILICATWGVRAQYQDHPLRTITWQILIASHTNFSCGQVNTWLIDAIILIKICIQSNYKNIDN